MPLTGLLTGAVALAGLAVLAWYAWRRGRGADPLPPRPAGGLPDTTVALVVGAMLWVALRDGLVRILEGSEFRRHGGFAADVLAFTALNVVIALGLLRPATRGAREPALPPLRLAWAGALGALVVFAAESAIGLAMTAVYALVGGEVPKQHVVEAAQSAGGPDLVALAAGAVVMAPFAEEVFFRGILLPAAVRALGARQGLMFQALAFGAIHVVGDWHIWPLAIPLAVVGWCAGWIYLRTGSLAAPIVLHATFNAINFAALRAAE